MKHVLSRRVKVAYLICSSPRTGSFLLCDALRATGVAGNPTEIFSRLFDLPESRTSDYSYLAALKTRIADGITTDGILGAKLHVDHLEHFMGSIGIIEGYRGAPQDPPPADISPELAAAALQRFFPSPRYVWLTRRDKLRQAISYLRARQSQVWWDADVGPIPTRPPTPHLVRFNFEQLHALIQRFENEERFWASYFDALGIQALRLNYEEIASSPFDVAASVLDHLGIAAPHRDRVAPLRMRQQADALTEEWIGLYREVEVSRNAAARQSNAER